MTMGKVVVAFTDPGTIVVTFRRYVTRMMEQEGGEREVVVKGIFNESPGFHVLVVCAGIASLAIPARCLDVTRVRP